MTLGLLPLARPTFDVAFAEERLSRMLSVIDASGVNTTGARHLLMDADQTEEAMSALAAEGIRDILVLQATFTDAVAIAEISRRFSGHLGIWAVPEPRLGERLRLNAFCGLNLAAHALGLRKRAFSWAYLDPDAPDAAGQFAALVLDQTPAKAPRLKKAPPGPDKKAKATAERLAERRIGRIGAHPDGFDTCKYDAGTLKDLTGVTVEPMSLETLFQRARDLPLAAAEKIREDAEKTGGGLGSVDAGELSRSLRLKGALDGLTKAGFYDAFAIRCWPETFTEYGGAICGPASMMGEKRVPCACEADVYGAVTQLMLQDVADAPVFLVDLVDIDVEDDTGVVWHCGQAPVSMAPEGVRPVATIHTNRKMPLLFEFPLKPGRVTLARISQARGKHQMVIGSGEMLERPMAFTGTSGVLRFDRGAQAVGRDVIGGGLEHHLAIAYGDHRTALAGVAAALDMPILEL